MFNRKIKSLNATVSPVNADPALIRYFRRGGSGGGVSPITPPSPYCSPAVSSKSSGSGGLRRSSSPLSVVENVKSPLVAYGTPVDDDVLVMDGVLVASTGGKGGKVLRSLPLDSGGSSSSSASSVSPGNGAYKTELCRAWEDLGRCRYGSKCQFAHGKEELRPTHFPIKNKAEVHTCKSCAMGSWPCVPRCHFLPVATPGASTASQRVSSEFSSKSSPFTNKSGSSSKGTSSKGTTPYATPKHLGRTPTSTKLEHSNQSSSSDSTSPEDLWMLVATTATLSYWSPLDDGIEVTLPSQTAQTEACSSREDVDNYINDVLYGPTAKKRLPLFTEFCQG